MTATIIGGGIIGLSTAYYLQKEGWDVTILDSSDGSHGCSFGNMGYLSPSHFAPLAQPGDPKIGRTFGTLQVASPPASP